MTSSYHTEYHRQVTFNYNSMMFKTAVQKDRFPSEFEGAATSFGGGGGLSLPKLSYVPEYLTDAGWLSNAVHILSPCRQAEQHHFNEVIVMMLSFALATYGHVI